jgi:hypothetical protein
MDVLFCSAGSADPVDGGLVELNDEGLVHVVDCRKSVLGCGHDGWQRETGWRRNVSGSDGLTFVVRVEDHILIVFVWSSECLPKLLHAGYIGDDFVVVATVVVRDNHCVSLLVCDVFDGIVKILEIRSVESAVEFVWNNSLHHDVDTEGIETFADELLRRN